MAEWQPIETAPKDGHWIIAYDEFVGPYPACYCDIFNRWETPDQNFLQRGDSLEEWFRCEPEWWQPMPSSKPMKTQQERENHEQNCPASD